MQQEVEALHRDNANKSQYLIASLNLLRRLVLLLSNFILQSRSEGDISSSPTRINATVEDSFVSELLQDLLANPIVRALLPAPPTSRSPFETSASSNLSAGKRQTGVPFRKSSSNVS